MRKGDNYSARETGEIHERCEKDSLASFRVFCRQHIRRKVMACQTIY